MKTDNRVVGLALMSLIISALVVFSFAKEVTDQPVEVIKNEFPSSGETTYTFSLVARKDIEHLELRFSVLYPTAFRSEELVNPEMFEVVHEDIGGYRMDPENGPEDVLGNIRRLTWFREKMEDQGIIPENYTGRIYIEDSEYDLLYYDYTPIMEYILGENETANLQLIHGAIVNSTGHFFYLEGVSAFCSGFIKILSISHNEEKVTYVPDRQVSEGLEQLPLSSAPHGVLLFQSVRKDDTVSIVINIQPSEAFTLQVIKVFADGELYDEPFVNVVR